MPPLLDGRVTIPEWPVSGHRASLDRSSFRRLCQKSFECAALRKHPDRPALAHRIGILSRTTKSILFFHMPPDTASDLSHIATGVLILNQTYTPLAMIALAQVPHLREEILKHRLSFPL